MHTQQFIYRAREANTLVDAFLMLGPKPSKFTELLPALYKCANDVNEQQRILQSREIFGVISRVPDYARDVKDDGKANEELITATWPANGPHKHTVIGTEPPPERHVSSFQFGSEKRLYFQTLVFYERLDLFLIEWAQQHLRKRHGSLQRSKSQ